MIEDIRITDAKRKCSELVALGEGWTIDATDPRWPFIMWLVERDPRFQGTYPVKAQVERRKNPPGHRGEHFGIALLFDDPLLTEIWAYWGFNKFRKDGIKDRLHDALRNEIGYQLPTCGAGFEADHCNAGGFHAIAQRFKAQGHDLAVEDRLCESGVWAWFLVDAGVAQAWKKFHAMNALYLPLSKADHKEVTKLRRQGAAGSFEKVMQTTYPVLQFDWISQAVVEVQSPDDFVDQLLVEALVGPKTLGDYDA